MLNGLVSLAVHSLRRSALSEGRQAPGRSTLTECQRPCGGGGGDGGGGSDGAGNFLVGWWGDGRRAYLEHQRGLSVEIKPAWPLPATHLDAHVSSDVIPLELQVCSKSTLHFLSEGQGVWSTQLR